jgi:uncharacterized protein YigA (DUF484 family)
MSEEQQIDSKEDMVRAFLNENPSFLADNPDILEMLELPHNSGKAVSLVERQVEVMRDRNLEMRGRLDRILTVANDNDLLFEKTKRLVLELLETQNLADMVSVVYDSLDNDFEVGFFSLILLGDNKKAHKTKARVVTTEEANERIGTVLNANSAVCGVLREEEMSFLFGDQGAQVGSVAAAPLRSEELYGILALGSADLNFYKSTTGTLFLDYIAEVLNRLLPKHLK